MRKTGNGRFIINHNTIEDDHWKLMRIEGIDEFNQFNSFCCGDDDLNDFIKTDAFTHKQELIVETYVLKSKEATGNFPVAFISFCNYAIPLTDLQKKTQKAFPHKKRYPNMPAVKIARLGVSSDLQRKDLGTHIINMAKEFFTTDNRTGCRFITVDAYNTDNVVAFYKKNDFQFLRKQDDKKQTRIMYLDLKRFFIAQ